MMTSPRSTRTFLPIAALFTAAWAAGAAACATGEAARTAGERPSGPTVVSAQSSPGTVEVDRNHEPLQTPVFLAEIRDLTAEVQEVTLQFLRMPIEVPMYRAGGTTWRAQLSPQQIRELAVGGETMHYEANVFVRDVQGRTAVSSRPLNIAVKAPEISG